MLNDRTTRNPEAVIARRIAPKQSRVFGDCFASLAMTAKSWSLGDLGSHARDQFAEEMRDLLKRLRSLTSVHEARRELFAWVNHRQRAAQTAAKLGWNRSATIIRDCARSLRSLLSERSEQLAKTSPVSALYDLARCFTARTDGSFLCRPHPSSARRKSTP